MATKKVGGVEGSVGIEVSSALKNLKELKAEIKALKNEQVDLQAVQNNGKDGFERSLKSQQRALEEQIKDLKYARNEVRLLNNEYKSAGNTAGVTEQTKQYRALTNSISKVTDQAKLLTRRLESVSGLKAASDIELAYTKVKQRIAEAEVAQKKFSLVAGKKVNPFADATNYTETGKVVKELWKDSSKASIGINELTKDMSYLSFAMKGALKGAGYKLSDLTDGTLSEKSIGDLRSNVNEATKSYNRHITALSRYRAALKIARTQEDGSIAPKTDAQRQKLGALTLQYSKSLGILDWYKNRLKAVQGGYEGLNRVLEETARREAFKEMASGTAPDKKLAKLKETTAAEVKANKDKLSSMVALHAKAMEIKTKEDALFVSEKPVKQIVATPVNRTADVDGIRKQIQANTKLQVSVAETARKEKEAADARKKHNAQSVSFDKLLESLAKKPMTEQKNDINETNTALKDMSNTVKSTNFSKPSLEVRKVTTEMIKAKNTLRLYTSDILRLEGAQAKIRGKATAEPPNNIAALMAQAKRQEAIAQATKQATVEVAKMQQALLTSASATTIVSAKTKEWLSHVGSVSEAMRAIQAYATGDMRILDTANLRTAYEGLKQLSNTLVLVGMGLRGTADASYQMSSNFRDSISSANTKLQEYKQSMIQVQAIAAASQFGQNQTGFVMGEGSMLGVTKYIDKVAILRAELSRVFEIMRQVNNVPLLPAKAGNLGTTDLVVYEQKLPQVYQKQIGFIEQINGMLKITGQAYNNSTEGIKAAKDRTEAWFRSVKQINAALDILKTMNIPTSAMISSMPFDEASQAVLRLMGMLNGVEGELSETKTVATYTGRTISDAMLQAVLKVEQATIAFTRLNTESRKMGGADTFTSLQRDLGKVRDMAKTVGKSFTRLGMDLKMVGAHLKSIPNDIRRATSEAYGMKNGFKDIARIVQGIVISQAFYKGLNYVQQEVSGIMEAFKQTETASIAFGTMFKELKSSEVFVRQLQDFAAVTPFTFEDTTKNARMLAAYGFQAKEIIPVMERLSDAGAATGNADSFERIVRAMGQIRSKGRLMGEEVRQLQEAGINGAGILQEQLGLTSEQMAKIGDLKIPAETAITAILKGITDKYGGASKALSESTSGMLSTISDNVKLIGMSVNNELFNSYKGFLAGMRDKLLAASQEMSKVGFGGWIDNNFSPESAQMFRVFAANMSLFGESIRYVWNSIKPLVTEFSRMAMTIFNLVLPALTLINAAIGTVINMFSSASPIVRRLVTYIGGLFIASLVASAIKGLVIAIKGLAIVRGAIVAIRGLTTAFWGLATAAMASGWSMALAAIAVAIGLIFLNSDAATKMVNSLSGAFSSLFGKKPSNFLKPDIDKSADALDNFKETSNKATDSLDDLGDAAKDAGKEAKKAVASFDEVFTLADANGTTDTGLDMEQLVEDVGSLNDLLMGGMPEFDIPVGLDTTGIEKINVKEILKPFVDGAISLATWAGDATGIAFVTDLVTGLGWGIGRSINIVGTGFKTMERYGNYYGGLITDRTDIMWKEVSSTIQSAVGIITKNTKEVWNEVLTVTGGHLAVFTSNTKAGLTAWWNDTYTGFTTWWTNTKTGFSDWLATTGSSLSTWWSDTKTGFSDWWGNTGEGLSTWWNNTTALFSSWKDLTWADVSTWWSDTKAGFTDWWTSTFTGLSTWWTDTKAGFSTWWTDTTTRLNTWWTDTKTGFTNWGISTMSGLVTWWADTKANWSAWKDSVGGIISTWWSDSKSTISEACASIKNSVSIWWSDIGVIFSNWKDAIGRIWSGVWTDVKNIWSSFASDLADSFWTWVDAFTKPFKWLGNEIGKIFGKVGSDAQEALDGATSKSRSIDVGANVSYSDEPTSYSMEPMPMARMFSMPSMDTSSISAVAPISAKDIASTGGAQGAATRQQQSVQSTNSTQASLDVAGIVSKAVDAAIQSMPAAVSVGTLIADDRGLAEFDRRYKRVQAQERKRGGY